MHTIFQPLPVLYKLASVVEQWSIIGIQQGLKGLSVSLLEGLPKTMMLLGHNRN